MIPDRDRPIKIVFADHQLHITLANGRILSAAISSYPLLASATPQQRDNVQMGLADLYWPDLKLDIGLIELMTGKAAPNRRKGNFCEG